MSMAILRLVPRFQLDHLIAARLLTLAFVQVAYCAYSLAQVLPAPAGTIPSEKVQALQQLALQEGEQGKTAEAILDYKRALASDQSWKEGWWNLGTLQYGANQFAEAEITFRKVIAFAPNLGVARALLGLSEFETEHYDPSLLDLMAAQEMGIKDDEEIQRVSTYHLALLLIRSSNFERAAGLLQTASESAEAPTQIKIALGLATLRIPILPQQLDPSHEALVKAAGEAAFAHSSLAFSKLIESYPDTPYLNYAYGRQLQQDQVGRDQMALQAFREESIISPASPLPWIAAGQSQLRLNQLPEAASSAQKAVNLCVTCVDAHLTLSVALEKSGKTKQAQSERDRTASYAAEARRAPAQWPEARMIQRYTIAVSSSTNSSQLWQRALREYTTEQYSEAASDLKQWLHSTPENGTGWAMLGLCEYATQDLDNAFIHLDRGSQLGLSGSPNSIDTARYTLGILLIHAGFFHRASEVLVLVRGQSPLASKAEFAMGLALLRKPDLPDAVPATQTSLVLVAGKIANLLEQSKYDQAFAELKPLLVSNPTTPFLHYAYGTALMALSEFDKAAEQIEIEITLSPKSELPWLRLASISLRQHKAVDAVKASERALALAPDSVEAHYLLGRASLESGDDAKARHELEVASKLSPGSPEIHFNLARAYAKADMPEQAQQERAAFAQLNITAEIRKSHEGSQVYVGPHDAGDLTPSQPITNPNRPQ